LGSWCSIMKAGVNKPRTEPNSTRLSRDVMGHSVKIIPESNDILPVALQLTER
jgi:hypothetical protein